MAKPSTAKRPNLVRVTDEMRRRSALLAEELLSWPDVHARPMFGLRAFYRRDTVFAMLPDKRAIGGPDAIGIKMADMWQFYEVRSEREIDGALVRLRKAYESVRNRKR